MITKSQLNRLTILAFSTLLLGCSNSNTLSSDHLFGIGKPQVCKGHFTPINTGTKEAKGYRYVR